MSGSTPPVPTPRNVLAMLRRHTSVMRIAPRPPVIIEFQPDAVEIEERPPPRVARATLYLVAALIISAILWASLSTVDKVIAAPGKLIATQPNLVIQPLETSVVREILVSVGETVRKGQVLAMLDPTFPQSDVAELRDRIANLTAEINRLEAELAGTDYTIEPGAPLSERLQRQLYLTRKAFYSASVRNLDAQIAHAESDLAANRAEQALAASRVATLKAVEDLRSMLFSQQVGSRLNLLQSHEDRLNAEENLSRLQGSEAGLEQAVAKARAESDAFIGDFRKTALQQLLDDRGKNDLAKGELAKAGLRHRMVTLTAPADATVLDVAQRSVGSVVREAETLFVLVPRDAPLEAEVDVDGKDIGGLAVGEPVRIKFDAFPFQRYGTATGNIRVISQDAFTADPKTTTPGQSPLYYRMRVTLTDTRLRDLPATFRLMPGMALTAETAVGHRSVISYFLYPLLRGLDESIREP